MALANGTRFLVHLININPSNAWVNAVISLSNVFVAPFDGIFGNEAIRIGGGAIDLPALLSLVACPILMFLIFWALDAVGFLRAD
jgi:hypothetical protein